MASSIGRWLDSLREHLLPAEPEQVLAIREQLKWFNKFEGPPVELVEWFARVHPRAEGEGVPQVLPLATALERRKWILRGTPEHPDDQHFDGRSNWLPLIAWDRNLLIYESGPARSGLVLRNVDRRERYLKDRTHPIPLPTFDVAQLIAPPEAEEDDDALAPMERLAERLELRPRAEDWSPAERLPFFRGVPAELMDWFRLHDGQEAEDAFFQKALLGARWRALGLDEAVVFRDLMLVHCTAALSARLERDPRWVPLFVVAERDLVVYAEDRGLAFHARRGDHFDVVPWNRWVPFAQFLDAALALLDPEPPEKVFADDDDGVDDGPYRMVAELQAVTAELEEPLVQREAGSDVLPEDLGLSPDVGQQVPAWFEANVGRPGSPLLAEGERVLSGREALGLRAARDLGRPWLPLAAGQDGVLTAWVEGLGMAELQPDGSMVPLATTFLVWLEGLWAAAHEEVESRRQPGSIARSPMGVWTVDVAPMTAPDVVAALHALPWSFTRGNFTLTLERAPELGVRAEARSWLVLELTDAVIDQMIADLEALEGYERATLHWEDVHDLVLVVRAKS